MDDDRPAPRPYDSWDADPEDVELIRDGLADGLIGWEAIPTEEDPDSEPLVSERAQFKMLAEQVAWMRKLSESDVSGHRTSEKLERALAPYIRALVVLVIVGLLWFVMCYPSDDECLRWVKTGYGRECVEHEIDALP